MSHAQVVLIVFLALLVFFLRLFTDPYKSRRDENGDLTMSGWEWRVLVGSSSGFWVLMLAFWVYSVFE